MSAIQPPEAKITTRFEQSGYVILRSLAATDLVEAIRQETIASLEPLLGPAEFEADVQYPGAPDNRQSTGGHTPRRLLHACGRSKIYRDWATSTVLKKHLQTFLHSDKVMLSQSHHNCMMTKFPGYSSTTSWHQDNRYWSFDQPNLVSVWLALGEENASNGGLMVIPNTHKQLIKRGRLDRNLFLRTDIAENQSLIDSAIAVNLNAGDVLFFHSQTFHAAGMNHSDTIKTSLVFTYHAASNLPIPGTRSADYPSLLL